MNNNSMYSTNDNSLYNNQYNNNVIYTTYQNTSTQPSIVSHQSQSVQQDEYSSLQYTQASQSQYISTNSLPSPISINYKNENLGNPPNQNQSILYSPVSSASTASPTASNTNTFSNSDPNSLSPISVIRNSTAQSNNIITNPNNNTMQAINNSNNKGMSMNFANDKTTDLNNNHNYNQNINNFSTENNSNANSNISNSNGSYIANNKNSYSSNQYVSSTTTSSTNSYYSTGTNNNNNNQFSLNQQSTPLPVPQQNIGVMDNNTMMNQSTQANTQSNHSYIFQQQNMSQQNNQNMIVVNSNDHTQTQNRPMALFQNSPSTFNQVYYANNQGPNGIPSQMQNPNLIFNSINENFLYEQQKKISMELAIKRKKNTEAARRSRMRKMQRMEKLEKYVKQLENDNSTLNMKISLLEASRPEWIEKESKLRDRIRELEKELAGKLKKNNIFIIIIIIYVVICVYN